MLHWQRTLRWESRDTLVDVRRKFRLLALRTHPDKKGGSATEFQVLKDAMLAAERFYFYASPPSTPRKPTPPPSPPTEPMDWSPTPM